MKATLLSFGALAALLIAGCSREAKQDKAQAGAAVTEGVTKTGGAATGEVAVATVAKKAEAIVLPKSTSTISDEVGPKAPIAKGNFQ